MTLPSGTVVVTAPGITSMQTVTQTLPAETHMVTETVHDTQRVTETLQDTVTDVVTVRETVTVLTPRLGQPTPARSSSTCRSAVASDGSRIAPS